MQLIACTGHILATPDKSIIEINKILDTNLDLHHASVQEIMEEYIMDINKQDSADAGNHDMSFAFDQNTLFHKNPKYADWKPLDIMNPESINEYYLKMVKGHLTMVLQKYCRAKIVRNKEKRAGYQILEIL